MLEEEAVPEELKQEIEERKEMDFKLTYEDNGKLYIARGYGEKETGGYSISVKDVYLTQNALRGRMRRWQRHQVSHILWLR